MFIGGIISTLSWLDLEFSALDFSAGVAIFSVRLVKFSAGWLDLATCRGRRGGVGNVLR